ncbi:MAG: hypothetical protein IT376_21850 [Polyangiaceae bacterium]|nr:hypothetical protein [Polyangiaceae bacterium]
MSGAAEAIVSVAGVSDDPLVGVDLQLGPGLHVVLGRRTDGADVLVDRVAGVRAPRRGRVRVLGADPHRRPAVRRRMGVLLPAEVLSGDSTVEAAVELAVASRGARGGARAALERAGLGHLASARCSRLDAWSCRAVVLALALADPLPEVLVLHEPLAYGADRVRSTLARLREAARRGVCALVVTSSPVDAARLGAPVTLLLGGRVVRSIPQPLGVGAAPGATELLVTSTDARALLAALATDSAVGRVALDATAGGRLTVAGPDRALLGLALARAALASGARLVRVEPRIPTLAEAAAAAAGLARGAWEAARSEQLARVRAAVAPAVPSRSSGASSADGGARPAPEADGDAP